MTDASTDTAPDIPDFPMTRAPGCPFAGPPNDDNGRVIDFSNATMSAVWDEIEDAGLQVTHHIGESQPKCPSEVNCVAVAMMVNIDSFREMFAKYIFGGRRRRSPGRRPRRQRKRQKVSGYLG